MHWENMYLLYFVGFRQYKPSQVFCSVCETHISVHNYQEGGGLGFTSTRTSTKRFIWETMNDWKHSDNYTPSRMCKNKQKRNKRIINLVGIDTSIVQFLAWLLFNRLGGFYRNAAPKKQGTIKQSYTYQT